MKARLELSDNGAIMRLALILPQGEGRPVRHTKVEFNHDTKAIGQALARLLEWMVSNTDV
jgi:hypothetical protein